MKKPKPIDTFLYQHFKRTGHSPNDVLVQQVEKLLMILFTTKVTFLKCLILTCFLSWKFENVNLDRMVNGKRKKRAVKRSNTSLKDLSKVLEDHGRHSMLSFLSLLRILDTEANKFYDKNHQLYDAALLTRCYTQHALRPFIDSEINHKRHFIKIPFINKGIEFIDLPSIFKDRSVNSLIPAYFQNSEPPIICHKYKPIRNTVFNFNKLVSNLDIHAITPES